MPNFTYFGTNDISGIFCISKETGKIYYQSIDENENPILGDLYFNDIKSLLIISLFCYLDKFSNDILFQKDMTPKEIHDIEEKLTPYHLNDIQRDNMRYYIKENMLYSINFKRGYMYKNLLHKDFLDKIYK